MPCKNVLHVPSVSLEVKCHLLVSGYLSCLLYPSEGVPGGRRRVRISIRNVSHDL